MEKRRRPMWKERKIPASLNSNKLATTTRIKTSARVKKGTLGLSPTHVEVSGANEEEAEEAALVQLTWKKFLIGRAIFTREATGGQQTIPRRNVIITRSGKKKANTTGETTMKETLVRLMVQAPGRTMRVTPGRWGSTIQ